MTVSEAAAPQRTDGCQRQRTRICDVAIALVGLIQGGGHFHMERKDIFYCE